MERMNMNWIELKMKVEVIIIIENSSKKPQVIF